MPEPDPYAPHPIQPVGELRFSEPCLILGVVAPKGEVLEVQGSAFNDGFYVVTFCDGESVRVAGSAGRVQSGRATAFPIRDEPPGVTDPAPVILWHPEPAA
jgi:hypothetical protein